MPTSYQGFITDIVDKVIEINPKSVLDLGAGFGKWGFLCREYLDVRMFNYKKEDWKVKIDCIEIFPEYITDCHRYVYNNIIIGDVYNELLNLDKYELIIACDVIEHYEKSKALEVIEYIKSKSHNCIITLPLGNEWGMQGAICGNVYETHRSEWEVEDFDLTFKSKVLQIDNKRIGMFTWSAS